MGKLFPTGLLGGGALQTLSVQSVVQNTAFLSENRAHRVGGAFSKGFLGEGRLQPVPTNPFSSVSCSKHRIFK